MDLGSNRTIESGLPIRVDYVLITNKGAGAQIVDFQDADGNSVVEIIVPASSTSEIDQGAIWDNGMTIPSVSAQIVVSIFHSSPA